MPPACARRPNVVKRPALPVDRSAVLAAPNRARRNAEESEKRSGLIGTPVARGPFPFDTRGGRCHSKQEHTMLTLRATLEPNGHLALQLDISQNCNHWLQKLVGRTT